MTELRPITNEEWAKYRWVEVSTYGNAERIFIRDIELTEPPDDGFKYIECTTRADNKQRWRRIMTYTDNE